MKLSIHRKHLSLKGMATVAPEGKASAAIERKAQRVLRSIIGIVTVVFALFYLVGFNLPYEENPAYNEPMLTDYVLILMWLVFIVALGFALWSVVRTARSRKDSRGNVYGVPVRKVAYFTVAGTIILLLIGLLFADTTPIVINGKTYDDKLWLTMSSLFVISSLAMLTITVAAVIFASINSKRKENRP